MKIQKKIRLGVSQISFSLPVFLAKEERLFEKENLKVDFVTNYAEAQTLCQDIVSGKLDVGGQVALPIILDEETTNPGTIQFANVAVEDHRHKFSFLLTKKESNISSFDQLQGKTIGIFPTKAFQLWIKIILQNSNVDPDSVTIKQILPEKQFDALSSGAVDAVFTNDPTASELLNSEEIMLLTQKALLDEYVLETSQGFPIGGFVFRKSFIREFPIEAEKIVKVLEKAITILEKNPAKAKKLCKKYYPKDQQKIISSIQHLTYWKQKDIKREHLQDLVDVYYHNNLFDKPANALLLLYEPDYRVKVSEVRKSRVRHGRKLQILKDFNLEIKKGEFLTIFGPNASGKTTLLNIIGGLVEPDTGKVTIKNRPPSEVRIGYVYQDYRKTLMPWKKIIDNIAFPLKIRGLSKPIRHQEVRDLCELLNIKINLDGHPQELSGGQQQTIAILTALIDKPEILLLDEPFSALDFQATLTLQNKIMDIWDKLGITVIFVSHDIDEAVFLANKICLLTNKPTKVKQIFKNELPYPRNLEDKESATYILLKNKIIRRFTKEVSL